MSGSKKYVCVHALVAKDELSDKSDQPQRFEPKSIIHLPDGPETDRLLAMGAVKTIKQAKADEVDAGDAGDAGDDGFGDDDKSAKRGRSKK